jgi:hypothetical protein
MNYSQSNAPFIISYTKPNNKIKMNKNIPYPLIKAIFSVIINNHGNEKIISKSKIINNMPTI